MRKISGFPFLPLLLGASALPVSVVSKAGAPAAESPVYELKTGVVATGASEAVQSPLRYKSGAESLRWRWRDATGALELRNPALGANPAGGVGFWIHNAISRPGSLRAELVRGGEVVGAFRIRLDFTGWRPVIVPLRATGFSGAKPDLLRLSPPAGSGEVFIDGARFDFGPKEVSGDGGMTLPESVVRSAVAGTPEPARPWLAALAPTGPVTVKERADMAAVASRLLPAPTKPKGSVPAKELEEIRKVFTGYRIRREGGAISGIPVIGACAIAPKEGVAGLDYLRFCERVARAYARAGDPRVEAELRRMYVDLCEHWLDQGWVAGGEVRVWDNYPSISLPGFASMREVLAEAGLLRRVAFSLAWSYGCQGVGDYLLEKPYASMDGLGFWANELPGFLCLLPDERERLHALRVAKRAYNLMLVNPHTIAPDGAVFHHGAFHFAYASYNLPRLVRTIAGTVGTEFFITPEAQDRLRRYARAISFTVSGGQQPYNLPARAGTPINANMGAFAASLAALGSPDGKQPYDREMAALALSQYAEQGEAGKAAMKKPPLSGWIADGVKPESLSGFLAINGGPVAVHRRPGWLVAIAGQSSNSRGLEIYGWTKSNNYARYARHGSICVVAGGSPPSLAESGWSYDGWDWSRFPGTTSLRLGSRELFEGYTMASNANPRCGGAALDADGVWGMDAACGGNITFKKSVFCFDDRITVLTTDITSGADAPAQTTLFQNRIREGHTLVAAGDGSTLRLPAEKTFGDEAAWLLDNQGVGYLLPAGHAPVVVRCAGQQWTYMIGNYLKDSKKNPFPSNNEYRYWSRRGKDMVSLESHYRPSEGDFATAWFDHGVRPKDGSALYTIVVRADAERLKALTKTPPVVVLRRDSAWHAVRDIATGAEAYCVYVAGGNTGEGRIRKVNMPVFAMVKPAASGLKVSIASTDVKRGGPVVFTLAGSWKAASGEPSGVTTVTSGDETTVTVEPEYYQAARFRLEAR